MSTKVLMGNFLLLMVIALNLGVKGSDVIIPKGDPLNIVCRTADNFTETQGSRAQVRIMHNDKVVLIMSTEQAGITNYSNVILNHTVITESRALQLEFDKTIAAQTNDSGMYACIINGKVSSETMVTVVEGANEEIYVEEGGSVNVTCIANPSNSTMCQWYINGVEKAGSDCSNMQFNGSDTELACKVVSRDQVEAAGNVTSVPDSSSLTFVKSLHVVRCNTIPPTVQPKRMVCRVHGNVEMWFFDDGKFINSSCERNNSTRENTCIADFDSVSMARLIVIREGQIKLNITLGRYQENVFPNQELEEDTDRWWIALIIITIILPLALTFGFYMWKGEWWWKVLCKFGQDPQLDRSDRPLMGNNRPAQPVHNGEAMLVSNGEAQLVSNGEALPVSNGEAQLVSNGETLPVSNGEALLVSNGEPVSNGDVRIEMLATPNVS